MPSTMSSSVSRLLASSTVMTPSLPTFCIALARKSPISLSPFAEMVPTWAISSFDVTFLELVFRCSTMASTARSMPRFRSMGFMPAATDLEPSFTIAWASTVAVVVPSPAKSDDFEATSRTIWAPMFSNLSSSSISLATVTPSLVMRGAPNDLSSTTLRPLGPRVTLTALARMSTPRSILSRASTENLTSLAAIVISPIQFPGEAPLSGFLARRFDVGEDAHDVALFHDQVVVAIDLDLGTRPLAEQHALSNLHIDGNELAVLVASARADGNDFALLRLLLDGVRDDDSAGGLFLGGDALDDNAIVKRTKFHAVLLSNWKGLEILMNDPPEPPRC